MERNTHVPDEGSLFDLDVPDEGSLFDLEERQHMFQMRGAFLTWKETTHVPNEGSLFDLEYKTHREERQKVLVF